MELGIARSQERKAPTPQGVLEEVDDLPVFVDGDVTIMERMVASSIGACLTSIMSIFYPVDYFDFSSDSIRCGQNTSSVASAK
jgi:hypothetical protein